VCWKNRDWREAQEGGERTGLRWRCWSGRAVEAEGWREGRRQRACWLGALGVLGLYGKEVMLSVVRLYGEAKLLYHMG
jgi:hypothetical protein